MSGYSRRIIANRILRTLSKHGKLASAEVERLEKNVSRLVRTQDVYTKTRQGDPQYRLSLGAVSKITGVSSSQEILSILTQSKDDLIERCVQDKAGLLLKINNETFHQLVLQAVQKEEAKFGSISLPDDISPPLEKVYESVVVEYSSPNIAKPFHAGHLRSTIIGNFIANLYEFAGHTVHRINYLGDWGTQFGLLALGYQRYGSEELLTADPLLHLFQVYVKINKEVEDKDKGISEARQTYQEGLEIFSKLEQGDPDLLMLWKRFRDLSLEEYTKMYQRLGVRFSAIQYESEYSEKTQELLASLRAQGLLKFNDQGVGYVDVTDKSKKLQARLVKSDGSSLYLARDVAAALERQEQFSPSRMHYVVEKGQHFHFQQLVAVLQQLNIPWSERPLDNIHIQFGRIEGMSSRRGTVVFLRDILDEARDRLAVSMKSRQTTRTSDVEAVADKLAVSAVAVQDMKGRRRNNYTFSWDRMLSFTGDSGVFLQYAHSRLCSLKDNCGIQKTIDIDPSCLHNEEIHHLLLLLARYPEVIEDMLESLEPCTLVQYLLKLSHLINSAYSKLPVKGENLDVAQARLLVFDSGRQVLSSGLQLLGIQPLKEM